MNGPKLVLPPGVRTPRPDNCTECRWADAVGNGIWTCHGGTPQIVLVEQPCPLSAAHPNGTAMIPAAVWPNVGQHDFCRHFARASPSANEVN